MPEERASEPGSTPGFVYDHVRHEPACPTQNSAHKGSTRFGEEPELGAELRVPGHLCEPGLERSDAACAVPAAVFEQRVHAASRSVKTRTRTRSGQRCSSSPARSRSARIRHTFTGGSLLDMAAIIRHRSTPGNFAARLLRNRRDPGGSRGRSYRPVLVIEADESVYLDPDPRLALPKLRPDPRAPQYLGGCLKCAGPPERAIVAGRSEVRTRVPVGSYPR